jgi:uncharacterized protein (DUF488 family)
MMISVTSTTIYSIGQGSRTLTSMVSVLREHAIGYLCDVRSVPISNHHPEFCRDELKRGLGEHGLKYVFLGNLLGGKPKDASLLDADGFVNYSALIASPGFVAGIDRVVGAAKAGKAIALFCSEAAPENCHRSKAVGRALGEKGLTVKHIDQLNSIILQENIFAGTQLAFFENSDVVAHSRKKIVI